MSTGVYEAYFQPRQPGPHCYQLNVRVHKVGIQVGPSTKGGRNVLTLYDRHVAGWILRFAQDDK
jgi:hypothetical protein